MKTTIQATIDRQNHIISETSSTMKATKQALYNRMFKANNFTSYVPTFNESKFELLINHKVHIAITSHCLKNLEKKGNLNAGELLRNINHTISKEDLESEVLLKFVEYSSDWDIEYNGNVTFHNEDVVKAIFSSISTHLYQFQTKHYKHMYIEIDGDIVDANKVSELADYVCIDNLLEDIDLQAFINKLEGIDKDWLLLRLQGISNRQIAISLSVTYEKIRSCEKRVRKMWNK